MTESPLRDVRFVADPRALGLVRPSRQAADDRIQELTERFRALDAGARTALTASIHADEFRVLLEFIRRAAVFALRHKDPEHVRAGLTAAAMIDYERIDYRDFSLELLAHAATRLGAPRRRLFEGAAALAHPPTAAAMLAPGISRVELATTYEEVETTMGAGLMTRGFDPYRPAHDFPALSIEIADLLIDHGYAPGSPELAVTLPRVWLRGAEHPQLEAALDRVRAGAAISAHMFPDRHPVASNQMIHVFVIEASPPHIAVLEKRVPELPRTQSATIGVAHGQLFALAVGGTDRAGVRQVETVESMYRFEEPLRRILGSYKPTRRRRAWFRPFSAS